MATAIRLITQIGMHFVRNGFVWPPCGRTDIRIEVANYLSLDSIANRFERALIVIDEQIAFDKAVGVASEELLLFGSY